MKKKDYDELFQKYQEVDRELREICNLIMKIKRKVEKSGKWLSAGYMPELPLTDEAQQGPLITKLYEKVEQARNVVRKIS